MNAQAIFGPGPKDWRPLIFVLSLVAVTVLNHRRDIVSTYTSSASRTMPRRMTAEQFWYLLGRSIGSRRELITSDQCSFRTGPSIASRSNRIPSRSSVK